MKILAVCGLLIALMTAAFAAEPRKPGEYPPTADSLPQPGVPKGKLIGPLEFHSKIIANTVRRYWIYVPAKYDPKNPPNLLVFQDGQRAINPQGPLNIPVVLASSSRRAIPAPSIIPTVWALPAVPAMPAREIPTIGRRNMMLSAIPIRAS
jgi:hypothetical protein